MKLPHKKRIQVAVELLSEFMKNLDSIDRSKAVEMLRRMYSIRKLQPIKGKANPPDIFDKEMATLYVIGKYGLKLDSEFPELFDKVFYIEKILDDAVGDVLEGRFEDVKEKLKRSSHSGVVDSNIVARMLRIPLTKFILGFTNENELREVLQKTAKALPDEERTVNNYAKFFVSLKLAEMIYKGEVKSKEEKEAFKKALAIRVGFPRATPSDDYVRVIAKNVFGISDEVLDKLLTKPRERHGMTATVEKRAEPEHRDLGAS
ncbi:MAG: DUF2192 domain-containing protein [Desulfurococcaceae archaeon]